MGAQRLTRWVWHLSVGLISRGSACTHSSRRERRRSAAKDAQPPQERSREMQQSDAYPVRFAVDYPDRDLNRLTTFFRLFAAIPITIVLSSVSAGTWQW